MLQQNPGVPRVLGRDKIDIFQNFQRAKSDIAQVSDWGSDDVKHCGEFEIRPTRLTRNERIQKGAL
jgi:hypothetical protein